MGEKLHVFRKGGAVWKAGLCKIEVKNGKRADGKDRAFTNEPCKSGAKYPTFIQQNPDTTFYLFVPPYSILFWDIGAPQGGNRRAALHAGGYGGAAFGLPQCKAVLLFRI